MSDRVAGGCLCGAVRLTARVPKREILACHCGQCRRWTGGGPLFSVRVEEPRIEGAESIGAFHASAHGERAFCTICGTTLYWRMRGGPVTSVAAGVLDDQSGFAVTEEIFCDRRAPWTPPYPDAAQSTEAQESAKLAAFLARTTD